ncbi:MAG TPA: hypothetical protein VG818_07600 [Gemmatimonadaceae bacterium]|jgi:drug/metabolite transporter (DMT)-like permease|nr:hypothetical protein [Gemmatimonadaceae bacterium]
MSRFADPAYMLRAASAVFGAIFLPIGLSFLFVQHHAHWKQGVGAILAAAGFFYVAFHAYDILGFDEPANPGDDDSPRNS